MSEHIQEDVNYGRIGQAFKDTGEEIKRELGKRFGGDMIHDKLTALANKFGSETATDRMVRGAKDVSREWASKANDHLSHIGKKIGSVAGEYPHLSAAAAGTAGLVGAGLAARKFAKMNRK